MLAGVLFLKNSAGAIRALPLVDVMHDGVQFSVPHFECVNLRTGLMEFLDVLDTFLRHGWNVNTGSASGPTSVLKLYGPWF